MVLWEGRRRRMVRQVGRDLLALAQVSLVPPLSILVISEVLKEF